MEANKILSADVLDIIFEGKNKEYGAYQLRKAYKKTLTKALIITGAALLLVLGANMFSKYMDDNDKKTFDTLE
ncbi:MAG: energy transducer TonB, partial [Ferruginibacter sp.]